MDEILLQPLEIQGNVLGGFNKDHQTLLHVRFGPDLTPLRAWLQIVALTDLATVVAFRRAMQGGKQPAPALWTSVSFSWAGLSKLTPDAAQFADATFHGGMSGIASAALGDPHTRGAPGEWSTWIVGGGSGVPDMLVLLAADDPTVLPPEVERVSGQLQACGATILHYDDGHNLAFYSDTAHQYPSGHEHFGFKDGISQPGVRGRMSAAPGDYLTPRNPGQPTSPSVPELGLQGETLIHPGQFILGYPAQSENDALAAKPGRALAPQPGGNLLSAGTAAPVAPWWAANGSFLVFRRLRQDVTAFRTFVSMAAARVAADTGVATLADGMGALLVGRWASGAPVNLAPAEDDPQLGDDDAKNNLFDLSNDMNGAVCPLAAHIRKVNPRAAPTDDGDANHTLTRRILRRGIAYGLPLPPGAPDDGVDRGLLFLSYQTDLIGQFQFLQQSWANLPKAPTSVFGPSAGIGNDMVIGQSADRVRSCVITRNGVESTISTSSDTVKDWVVATGGIYYFTPSVSAIRTVLGAANQTS